MKLADDLQVKGKRVLVRSDLNVPLEDGAITDDGRIRASLPLIRALAEQGAKVVVAAHLGRPKGTADPKYSLAPVAERLEQLLGRPVRLARDVVGPDAQSCVAELREQLLAVSDQVADVCLEIRCGARARLGLIDQNVRLRADRV